MWLRGLAGYAIVAVIGAIVGWIELARRYGDRPFGLLTWPASWLYLVSNALAALLALLLVRVLQWDLGLESDAREILTVLASGFGAMVIFRSRVFTAATPQARDGHVEQLFAPARLFEEVLEIADRQASHKQTVERWELITSAAKIPSWEEAKARAVLVLHSMPRGQSRTALARNVRALNVNAQGFDDKLRVQLLGVAVIDAAGRQMLKRMLRASTTDKQQLEPD